VDGQLQEAHGGREREKLRRRAVWQKQGGGDKKFVYDSSTNKWLVSDRESMKSSKSAGYMCVSSSALTPDQACLSEVWRVSDNRQMVEAPGVRFVASHP
jgi:hypothetical protein